jgi:hypothetical protein
MACENDEEMRQVGRELHSPFGRTFLWKEEALITDGGISSLKIHRLHYIQHGSFAQMQVDFIS